MRNIQVTSEFGIIVRRAALAERGVSWTDLLRILEASAPFDSNETLASFGPHFGQEALGEFLRRLSAAGLVYFDDFVEFTGVWSEWCRFKVYSPD
jgi:hypothetical protein